MQFVTHRVAAADVRRISHAGREYLVVPTVMIREGVLNGEYVPAEEIARFPEAWNGRPIPLAHPEQNGRHVSANSPEIYAHAVIGQIWNATANGKLLAEMWIDLAKAEELGGDALEAVRRFEAGEPVDVSTAYFRDLEPARGTFDGQEYQGVARNIRPDHLAILLHEQGACSWDDGCGAPRVNGEGDVEGSEMGKNGLQANLRTRVWMEEQARTWLAENGYSTDSMLKLANFFVFRQAMPSDFDSFSDDGEPFEFSFEDGVVATFGVRVRNGEIVDRQVQSIKFYHGEEDMETRPAIRSNESAFSALREALKYLVYGPEMEVNLVDEKEQLIKQIVANEQAGWEQSELEALDVSVLQKLVAMLEQPEQPAAQSEPVEPVEPVADQPEPAVTVADELPEVESVAPEGWAELKAVIDELGGPESIKQAIATIQANAEAERVRLVASLAGRSAFDEEELKAMSVVQLEKLEASLRPASFLGQGTPRAHQRVEGPPEPPVILLAELQSETREAA